MPSSLFVRALVVLLACLGGAGPVAAQEPATAHQGFGPDMAPRVAACTACHGREGQATRTGYFPRIAGKPAGYLYEQLRSFRDGRRTQPAMQHLLSNLSDAYLREMAAYFAAQQHPYPAPPPSDLSAELLARGRALVLEGDAARGLPACASCHGAALTGVEPGVPGLLGLPRLYIASQLGAWLTGERRALAPDCMAEVGRQLNATDIQAVAGWLALQPMPADARAVAAHPLPRPCSASTAGALP
ncbi:c-type cytochrome [Xenophilus arseniciresistens]|uniref:C-type cytochrome n=1 Tax=Xenophilus arseniciresistens TaxID=1283306 RepID=A0AAE3SYN1_9BURK|nr:c-type cytochrome [Xenophilus arseniciresistens]MDA7414981.1 c-type cytochrome [Xenophilus arseniciresistens]